MQDYEKCEESFLKDMVMEFEFSGNTELAFVQRLLLANSDLDTWEKLAYALEKQLIAGARNEEVKLVKMLSDRWNKAICPRLAKEGCQFTGKGKWKEARKWLREVKFPVWFEQHHLIPLTCDQLWQHLWETATPTDKMKPVLLESLPTLDMGEVETAETEILSFPLDSKIRFEVNLDRAGYLLLLEKGPSGKIWCLCPSSNFAPKPQHTRGRVTLPQAGLDKKYFTLNRSGQEEIVAVITKEAPTLDWLPKPDKSLEEGNLTRLLEYLNHCQDCQVLRMAYRVTA